MSVGEKANLKCSPEYGYGAMGYPGVYPFTYEQTQLILVLSLQYVFGSLIHNVHLGRKVIITRDLMSLIFLGDEHVQLPPPPK